MIIKIKKHIIHKRHLPIYQHNNNYYIFLLNFQNINSY